MSVLIIALTLLTASSAPRSAIDPILRLGEIVIGEIANGDPVIRTPFLLAERNQAPVLGRVFVVQLDKPGAVYIDMRSYTFDSYLVLRNESGELIAEDDDGGLQQHARLVLEDLEAQVIYRVEACALRGGRGPFTIEMRAGLPPSLTAEEIKHAELDDFRAGIETMQEMRGTRDPMLAEGLHVLGWRLRQAGRQAEARGYLERSLAIRDAVLGAEHKGTVATVELLAKNLFELNEYEALIPLLVGGIEQLARIEEGDGPRTVELLFRYSAALALTQRFEACVAVYPRVIAAFEKNGWAGGLGFARIHRYTGASQLMLENSVEALAHLELAVELFESFDDVGESELAGALHGLGLAQWQRGQSMAAVETTRRALEIRERILADDDPSTILVRRELGKMYTNLGSDAEALKIFERTLEVARISFGPEDPETVQASLRLAHYRWKHGRDPAVFDDFPTAIALLEKSLGPDHSNVASALRNCASLMVNSARFAEARPLLERALAIEERVHGPDSEWASVPLTSLGIVYGYQGLHRESRACMERAFAIRERLLGLRNSSTIQSLHNLASAMQATGEVEEGLVMFRRELELCEELYGDQNESTIGALNAVGYVLRSLHRYGEALEFFERAVAASQLLFGETHERTATSQHNLAANYASDGRYREASASYSRAIATRRQLLAPNHPGLAKSLTGWAFCVGNLGDWDKALEAALEATAIQQAHLESRLVGLSEIERFRTLANQTSNLDWALSFAGLSDAEDAELRGYKALLAYKGIAGRLLTLDRERSLAALTSEQADILNELRAVQSQLSGSIFAEEVDERADAALRTRRNELELSWNRLLPRTTEKEIGLEDLRAALPEKSVLVDFYIHGGFRPAQFSGEQLVALHEVLPPRLSAWIVEPNGKAVTRVDLGPASDLERALHDHLAAVVREDRDKLRGVGLASPTLLSGQTGELLEQLIWKPLAALIGAAKLVFISPDSFLAGFPFEILQPQGEDFLIENHTFAYLQSALDLVRSPAVSTSDRKGLLVVGDVDYRTANSNADRSPVVASSDEPAEWMRGLGDSWLPLPGTRHEAETVGRVHREVTGDNSRRLVLYAREPTEARLKEEVSRYSTLHFATHGFFQPPGVTSLWKRGGGDSVSTTAPNSGPLDFEGYPPGLLSGLVLAGAASTASGPGEDGYLTAEEVAWLDLVGVDLVVLSACETGLGRPQSGEGMIGLRRAFHQAGARTVISSLWSVQDEATSELMQGFYRNLWQKGQGKLQALHNAQLKQLARNRESHGHGLPSTWGAFVLSGER